MNWATEIGDKVRELIALEWARQGHKLTGAFEEQLTYEVAEEEGDTIIRYYDTTERGYGKIIDDGVKPEQIRYPYARARIEALISYVKLRKGVTDDNAAKSIAFAIATIHKEQGMPSPDSSRYSETGKRINFVGDATQDVDEIVNNSMSRMLEEVL